MSKKYEWIKEKKLIGTRTRFNIDIMIFICFLLILFNIHPYSNLVESQGDINNSGLTYIFYDYNGNSYILNQTAHGAASSWEYLFDNDIPSEVKNTEAEDKTTNINRQESENINDDSDINRYETIDTKEISQNIVNLSNDNTTGADLANSENNLQVDSDSGKDELNIKDNQVSIEDIMKDLGINEDTNITSNKNNNHNTNNTLSAEGIEIDLSNVDKKSESNLSGSYDIRKEGNMLIVEYNEGGDNEGSNEGGNNEGNNEVNNGGENNLSNNQIFIGASFPFLEKGLIIPTLISREDIGIFPMEYDENNHTYSESVYTFTKGVKENTEEDFDYKDCMTPRGYYILHGESVLAYQQLDNAPNICNIERRFCRNGKLSGTFTQQGCSVNKEYSYSQRGEAEIRKGQDTKKENTTQNSDGSVVVNDKEIGSSFVFDKPSTKSTSRYESGNNIKLDDEVDQTERVYWDCTTPRGETVLHGQLVQAFKHANGFSDSPCEMQFRLCSMGELMGNYTEPTCKTRDTSFIDWINDSPTWDTYSKEKLQRVKKIIKSEKVYDKDYGVLTNSDALDKILQIMEE